MIAVDASVLVDLLLADGDRGDRARDRLFADTAWCAPDYTPAEVFSAIRGLHRGGHVTSERAEAAVDALGRLHLDLAPTRELLPMMWRLRDAIGAYDAGYVAVAVRHRCVLVTADRRLARGAAAWCDAQSP